VTIRRRALSFVSLFALGLPLALVARPAAAALHRLTNIHGSACQSSDPQNQPVVYSDAGMLIKVPMTPNPPPVSLACPVPWSQDFSVTQALQKIVVALDWTSAPVSTATPAFNPSCMFYMLTNNNGELWVPLTSVNNPNTSTPEYVFVTQSGAVPLPAYGTVIGSALYCNNVPVGVGILGYTIDTCFATSLLSGCS